MSKFALIGAAGFVAPRHMKAIKDIGGELVAMLDPHDSVGVVDKYFPNALFFSEFERFDRHLEKLKRNGHGVEYISICSPNYLHDAHCRLTLRVGADAICEKPLVLKPWNLDQLIDIERETGKKIYTVLQLRLHPELIKLKNQIQSKKYYVNIQYITPRGKWYERSWKGDVGKSGGLVTNIGIHLFDMMLWLFGNCKKITLRDTENDYLTGILNLENADVSFNLSTREQHLPNKEFDFYRSIEIDGIPLRFDNSFTDLHTSIYEDILKGNGFRINDARPSIELVYKIREMII
jgi:UDP-N-acetyl-2-amino-2-deoxyglucuronate dehydrogenase